MENDMTLVSVLLLVMVWAVIFFLDYYLTIYTAKLFKSQLSQYLTFEGSYEITPVYQKDVDALRLFSPQFFARWGLSILLLFFLGWITQTGSGLQQFFYFTYGGLFLTEAAVFVRHVRNITLARLATTPGSLRGHLEQSRWLALRVSTMEVFSFAVIYLVLAIGLRSSFLWGGAFFTAVTAWRHWRLAIKQRPGLVSLAAHGEPQS